MCPFHKGLFAIWEFCVTIIISWLITSHGYYVTKSHTYFNSVVLIDMILIQCSTRMITVLDIVWHCLPFPSSEKCHKNFLCQNAITSHSGRTSVLRQLILLTREINKDAAPYRFKPDHFLAKPVMTCTSQSPLWDINVTNNSNHFSRLLSSIQFHTSGLV